jgi:peptidyl-tRNA hydrolase, PTH2 family
VGLALVLSSLGIGYQLGTLSNSNPAVTPSNDTKPEPKLEEIAEKAEDENVDDDEDEEEISDGDLGSISAGFLEPCKLVRLIIRGFYFITFPFNWHRF